MIAGERKKPENSTERVYMISTEQNMTSLEEFLLSCVSICGRHRHTYTETTAKALSLQKKGISVYETNFNV